jgi:hypothetical protein
MVLHEEQLQFDQDGPESPVVVEVLRNEVPPMQHLAALLLLPQHQHLL